MADIRRCGVDDLPAILAIVNAAAEAYRGVIPADRWREPYMDPEDLETEFADGVAFWGYEVDGELFWGADAIGFVKAFLADPAALRNDEIRRVDALPVGAARKT